MSTRVLTKLDHPRDHKKTVQPSPLNSFFAGSISGTVSCFLFQPLDLAKTKMQIATAPFQHRRAVFPSLSLNGIANTVARSVKEEGLFSLWKGLVPSIYRQVPGVGLYFTCLYQGKKMLKREAKFYENLFIGAVSRTLVGVILLPLTVIKARFESGHFTYRSVGHALHQLWHLEGVRGLFGGLTATVARDAPFSGLYLMFYTQEKKVLKQFMDIDHTYTHFSCGIVAGCLASLVTHPADVVKTQLQLFPSRYSGTAHCISVVWRRYSIAGFMRGIVPRCLRRTLVSSITWTVFEEIFRKLQIKV